MHLHSRFVAPPKNKNENDVSPLAINRQPLWGLCMAFTTNSNPSQFLRASLSSALPVEPPHSSPGFSLSFLPLRPDTFPASNLRHSTSPSDSQASRNPMRH